MNIGYQLVELENQNVVCIVEAREGGKGGN